jgi:ABC-type phosphate transport system permease subunit
MIIASSIMTTPATNLASNLSISPRLAKNVRRNIKERIIEFILMLAALSAVFTTLSIVGILLYESLSFFKTVSVVDFFTDTQWTPLFEDAHYGIMPLISGTQLLRWLWLFLSARLLRFIYLNSPHTKRVKSSNQY